MKNINHLQPQHNFSFILTGLIFFPQYLNLSVMYTSQQFINLWLSISVKIQKFGNLTELASTFVWPEDFS